MGQSVNAGYNGRFASIMVASSIGNVDRERRCRICLSRRRLGVSSWIGLAITLAGAGVYGRGDGTADHSGGSGR
jgi:hypothetical protein